MAIAFLFSSLFEAQKL